MGSFESIESNELLHEFGRLDRVSGALKGLFPRQSMPDHYCWPATTQRGKARIIDWPLLFAERQPEKQIVRLIRLLVFISLVLVPLLLEQTHPKNHHLEG
jgi:hypothetical protein